ncbi:type VI secretion protein [Burkholderia gladioli pv. gladioli]|uniref:Type IV secretion system protein n=1 Tax=Burkholderia gladioli TaxID=28095 RepID=A0AAW3F7R7_BURGA|nr:type VI secretion protein [Burkholderia gladioli]AJW93686.1 putative type IV secretion system protein [Burkholderia gladioli]ASD84722.1 type VI secretion protein [Burkholderia gladioli pv. gladioli]AWY49758.1 type VI secretion protein [Burkholderia gladioli pv. gladioli]KGC17278.1 putative type IV secretion system protein [Burkholderia gladioli]MDJ1167582.1 type VI secretion protein [Burkholderia gladioli pv. gladioli]
MKFLPTLRVAALAASLFVTQRALALTVFDPMNYAQNVVTAAKAVRGEIYQNTNILYQYQMMMNDLLQAQNLNPAAWKAAYDQISGDISKVKGLVGTLQGLYGDLNKGGEWVTQVQGLISRSGKTNAQWFSDMNTLFQQNDKVARNLFQMGSNIMEHTNEMAQRRQDLQSQLSSSPTQQATAEITTHYLDIVTSQNSDILQLNAAKAQKDAQKDAQQAEDDQEKAADAEKFISKQQAERAAYGITTQ